ncbi:mitotic checkpoint serine/threonine-protein kinase BUB1 beta isoform X2 [Danio rerio]|uniref:Mitotic checkpoint serine/threonine-protein kinase BUB1 beta isoform X2 n=1 Tax=Danio rerio TaxID=7955 RepID=A0A8M2B836_DANRE|nr:mitotic checkpoint serine/threonine-protein kinase BUB1 beta isoform X2 [Danio rerio]|eukprot:XP_005160973.1 mitotic checkpoint serine/threonine-protein kinase BUB1 beta isoform X2 [Danio rerio]
MAVRLEKSQGLKMDELSSHTWSALGIQVEAVAPFQKSQTQEGLRGQREDNLEIMYNKDQIYQGDVEFSIEELRAQRYYKAMREKASHLNKMKQDLQLQIEQAQRKLHQRSSTAAPQQRFPEDKREASSSIQRPTGSCESAADTVKSAPLVIYSEQEEGCAVSSSSVSREDDMNQSGSDAKLQKTAKPFTIYDESTQTNKISSSVSREDEINQSGSDAKLQKTAKTFTIYDENSQTNKISTSVSREDDMNQSGSDAKLQKTGTGKPFTMFEDNAQTSKTSSSTNRKSLKLPTLSLKAPKSKAELVTDKDASISRSEEAIINGHRNKTLCRSPNDTCEFARAAQLASSPFAGVDRQKTPETGLMENLSPADPESTKAANINETPEEKKLSPILEISQEWGGSTFCQDPTKRLNDAESSRSAERPETELENVSKWQDVCSLHVRSRIFDQSDVTSLPNFHRKAGLLPDTSDDLHLDGEQLFYCSKLGSVKDFSLYSSGTAAVLLKTDRSSVPWDFFIISQLRSRGCCDEQGCDVQISCHMFENGSVTLWRIPHGDTLQDLLCEPLARHDACLLVILLLELVRCFHSCRLLHGGLKPESLYFYHSGLTALDFSDSVDLHLQTDVTEAQDLPSAQQFIQQGLLAPSASPYQVDLISVAEITHRLLFNAPLQVKLVDSVWRLDEDSASQHGCPVEPLWREFFHMILNPEKSSELVLSDLINNVKNSL